MRRPRNPISAFCTVCAVTAGLALISPISAQAQSYDGTWTGTYRCPAAIGPAFAIAVTATIAQNQFRLERNKPIYYELIQGMVQADGSISVSGQGQRRDLRDRWNTQFSGRASAMTINLTGQVARRSPCVIELSNTQPAPYSLAGLELTHQKQPAGAEAERRAEAERQRNAAAAKQAAIGRAQGEKSAKEQVAESQIQPLRSDAEAAKQKAAEFDKQLAALRGAQETQQQATEKQTEQQKAGEAQLQQLRAEAEAAKKKAADAEEQLAALRAAQEQGGKRLDDVGAFLKDMILPDSEQLEDWILHKAAIPIQQQQFCLIVKRFYPDLEKVEQVKNDIRRNMLYRDRQRVWKHYCLVADSRIGCCMSKK